MKTVTSKDNKIYKLCKQLSAKKYRDKLGIYMVEGTNLVEEAFKCGVHIEYIIVRSDYCDGTGLALIEDLKEVYSMDGKLFDSLCDTETPQGILAVVRKPGVCEEEFFRRVGEGNFVVLDRLQDQGNIGTIIRTADAAGYKGVVALKGCGDIYSPKTIRAAAGSVFREPVLSVETPQQMVRLLQKYGKRLVVSCTEASERYYDADLAENVALVIGNEGGGVCGELLAAADARVKIPMEGSIESLNAAVAAGILMYEAMRK